MILYLKFLRLTVFVQTGRKHGVNVSDPVNVDNCEFKGGEQEVNGYFEYVKENGGVQLVMCVMDRKDTQMYSVIKRLAERKFGFLTQCITMKSISKETSKIKISPGKTFFV